MNSILTDSIPTDIFVLGIDQLNNRFEMIGRGTSRNVYKISDTLVLKKPTSQIGNLQSSVEIRVYEKSSEEHRELLCPILKSQNNSIITLLGSPIESKTSELCTYLGYESRRNLPFYNTLKSFEENFELYMEEMLDIANWVYVDGLIKLADYGLTKHIWYNYYAD